MTSCKNCSTEFEGDFCPACGQKAKTERITFRQMLGELRYHVIDFDQGFWFTMYQLALRPGHATREYLEGKRVGYVKPVKFIFWAFAVTFLIASLTGMDAEFLQKLGQRASEQSSTTNLQAFQRFGQKLFEHPSFIILLMVLPLSFASWLLNWRKGYNFTEHLVMNTYLMAETILAGLVLVPLFRLLSAFVPVGVIGIMTPLLTALYLGWAYNQFYRTTRRVAGFFRALLIYALSYVGMILLVSVLSTTAIVLFKPYIDHWLSK
jgi:uncharacterized membrane protein (DUF373 family)